MSKRSPVERGLTGATGVAAGGAGCGADCGGRSLALALALLGQYAPERPVRLLGVRVAGLSADGRPGTQHRGRAADSATKRGEQLGLPV